MRILSQDGMLDIPYEQMIINVDYKNKNRIVACGVNCGGENSTFHIATYSTEAKAEKAMEMLWKAYSPVAVIKNLGNDITAHIKPCEYAIDIKSSCPDIRDNFYFQFPADEDVEG